MIDLIITLLLALQSGSLCSVGTPADYEAWLDQHPYAARVGEVRFENQLEFWLLDGDGLAEAPQTDDSLYLFVFNMDDYPHGSCFRQL